MPSRQRGTAQGCPDRPGTVLQCPSRPGTAPDCPPRTAPACRSTATNGRLTTELHRPYLAQDCPGQHGYGRVRPGRGRDAAIRAGPGLRPNVRAGRAGAGLSAPDRAATCSAGDGHAHEEEHQEKQQGRAKAHPARSAALLGARRDGSGRPVGAASLPCRPGRHRSVRVGACGPVQRGPVLSGADNNSPEGRRAVEGRREEEREALFARCTVRCGLSGAVPSGAGWTGAVMCREVMSG